MSNSALASLTAQYTDSENEEDHHEDEESADSQNSQVIIPVRPSTPQQATDKEAAAAPSKKLKKKKRDKKSLQRLVSYQDDTIISDDDGEGQEDEDRRSGDSSSSDSHSSEEGEQQGDSDGEAVGGRAANQHQRHHTSGGPHKNDAPTPMEVDNDSSGGSGANDSQGKMRAPATTSAKNDKPTKYAHYGFTLPLEPKGKPTPELSDKIRNLYEKMDSNSGMDMNRIIQERKEFRNPSIYEKLIQFCDINEFGTNYPPEIYDPLQWGAESYYEELARVQKNEMLKRQKERKDTDKIEQATALARKVEEEAKKRKSKWDQPAAATAAAAAAAAAAASVKPAVPTALTTTVTGTKGTVISAFGSLPKKPAA